MDRESVMVPAEHSWRHDRGRSYLFRPLSPKMGRRLDLYGQDMYEYWTEFEMSSRYVAINELPRPLADGSGAARAALSLDAVVSSSVGAKYGVLLTSDVVAAQALVEPYISTAEKLGLEILVVLFRSLRDSGLLRDNHHRMLRFLEVQNDAVTTQVLNTLLASVRNESAGITIGALQKLHCDMEPELCVAGIADLIRRGRASAELSTEPFDRLLTIRAPAA